MQHFSFFKNLMNFKESMLPNFLIFGISNAPAIATKRL